LNPSNAAPSSEPEDVASAMPDRGVPSHELRASRAVPWVISTYFAEGLPFSIVHQVSMELFTAMGASAEAVGLTALYGLPWNLKFLWGPVVDRYGTLRRWVVALQAALGIAVGLVAWPAQRFDLAMVARALLVVAVLAATHDVAVDGFYMRALGKADQAALSGLRAAAYRVAMTAGKGGLVVLAGVLSWRASFFTAGATLLLLALIHGLALPRERARLADAAPRSLAHFYLDAYRTFLAQPGARLSLAFILVYRAGDALMFAMSTKLLAHLGLGLVERGVLNGIGGAAGIAGSMVGGLVISRLGLRRTLAPIALVQGLAILLYVALAARAPSLAWINAAVIAERVIEGVGGAALMVFIMSRCSGEYRASHFALGSALMSVATMVLGSASGFLLTGLGYPAFFVLAYLATIPGIFLARKVPHG
jgi:PAT family beta-lactamase induction signal transducer AmpG